MSDAIDLLVELLDGSDEIVQGLTGVEFSEFLRIGMQENPKEFPRLVDSYRKRLQRARKDFSEDEIERAALANMGMHCLFADHDRDKIVYPVARGGGMNSIFHWYDDVSIYGPAMKAFAKYIGVNGKGIREFIVF